MKPLDQAELARPGGCPRMEPVAVVSWRTRHRQARRRAGRCSRPEWRLRCDGL